MNKEKYVPKKEVEKKVAEKFPNRFAGVFYGIQELRGTLWWNCMDDYEGTSDDYIKECFDVYTIDDYLVVVEKSNKEKSLFDLIKDLDTALNEAQRAKQKVLDYLEEKHDIDTFANIDTIEDSLSYVYGLDVDKIKALIERSANE